MDMILLFLFHPSSCHETCWKSRHLRLLLQYEIKFELANEIKFEYAKKNFSEELVD